MQAYAVVDQRHRAHLVHALSERRRLGVPMARGYQEFQYRLPRGMYHALSSRHPTTRRKLLYVGAIQLFCLYVQKAAPANHYGQRRVSGQTRAYWAKCLGLSTEREKRKGRLGEVHGARMVRIYDAQLRAMGLIQHGGYYEDPKDRGARVGNTGIIKKRRVTWIAPTVATHYAQCVEALAAGAEVKNGNLVPTDLLHKKIFSPIPQPPKARRNGLTAVSPSCSTVGKPVDSDFTTASGHQERPTGAAVTKNARIQISQTAVGGKPAPTQPARHAETRSARRTGPETPALLATVLARMAHEINEAEAAEIIGMATSGREDEAKQRLAEARARRKT